MTEADARDLVERRRAAQRRHSELAERLARTAGQIAETAERVAEMFNRRAQECPDRAEELRDQARRARETAEQERAEQARWHRVSEQSAEQYLDELASEDTAADEQRE